MGIYQQELAHHGIKGMKWGIRRYQNPDGTYTNAGKKRYGMNLDINDKSRVNVAKIRRGEAQRRLDVAKTNNDTNYTRIADLQGRLRTAKREVRRNKRVDKGAKLAAKGQTITKNNIKTAVGYGAAYLGTQGMRRFLRSRMTDLEKQGRWTPKHDAVAAASFLITAMGSYTLATLNGAYQNQKNSNLRSYNIARATGNTSLKRVGSQEYEDVINRRKQK